MKAQRGTTPSSMKNVKKVAITGGIGSGKSTALLALKNAGYATVSCDEVTKELYNKQSVLRALKKLFPAAIKGTIRLKADKAQIAKEAFSDKQKLDKLNALMHPKIMAELMSKLDSAKEIAFAEVPLLFEGGYQNSFDNVIVIGRSLESRIKSVKERSKLTDGEIKDRISNQIDYDTLDKSGFTMIENDGDKEKLEEAVLAAANKIKGGD